MSADFHHLLRMWEGPAEAGSGGPCFYISFKELTSHGLSSLLCAWQTFLFGTGRGDWQQPHRDTLTEVFLFDCSLTVI